MPDYDLKGGYTLKSTSPYGNPSQSTDIDSKTLTTLTATIDGVPATGKTLVRPVEPLQADAQAHADEDAAWLPQWFRDHMTNVTEQGSGVISGTYAGATTWVRASARVDPFNDPTTAWCGMGFCATGPSSQRMTDHWTQLHDDVIVPQ